MITRKKAITFDPSSPLEEDEEHQLTAADDQANLMYWQYIAWATCCLQN